MIVGGDARQRGTRFALPAARAALEIDRRLALPEKIARDWLLIGDIQRKIGVGDSAEAFRHALNVANAAGLSDIAAMATQALTENEFSVKADAKENAR